MALTWRAVAFAALGIVPVALWPVTGTVLVWAVVVVLVCGLDVALAASPQGLTVRRSVPTSARVGTPTTSLLVVTNPGPRRLRGRVRDAWPPSLAARRTADGLVPHSDPAEVVAGARHDVDLAPGASVRLRTDLLPTRRGERHAGAVTVRAVGPLGLAGRQRSLAVGGRLRVLPEFVSRRHLPSRLARLREMDGRAAVQVRGEGTEFDSLREYVVGDDVRSIDWRATARGGDVVVRTWRPERDRRVVVVVDSGRTSAARIGLTDDGSVNTGGTRLEASIEAALLLGALADRAGDRVQVLAFDRTVRAQVAGASGPRLLPAMAEALSSVEPVLLETDWPGLVAQVRTRVSQRALVVLLTSLDPAAVETGLLPVVDALTGTHQVVVAAVADAEVAALRSGREDADTTYDAAAAARADLERAAVAAVLRRHGAEVVEALPADLAPRLADAYLALKAAGRL